jgi:transposase-like protein
MDETYVKIKGVWKYLYRAVNKEKAHTFEVERVDSRIRAPQSS